MHVVGHPDQFTNPIPESSSPEFKEKFTFPMITNDQHVCMYVWSLHILVQIDDSCMYLCTVFVEIKMLNLFAYVYYLCVRGSVCLCMYVCMYVCYV